MIFAHHRWQPAASEIANNFAINYLIRENMPLWAAHELINPAQVIDF